mmetsp:Transcript_25100/g.32595  ORF Transcript_25100/g.32595 Transcript_25100/m.32595 type:complete len:324 (+) Transcript_25100:55-1026(+)
MAEFEDNQDSASVVNQFTSYLDPEMAIPVAAIKALLGVIKRSQATTMMGLESELREAKLQLMIACDATDLLGNKTKIALESGCELFCKYVTRCFLDFQDFEACKEQLLQRGQSFVEMSMTSRERIAGFGKGFVRENCVVMTHSFSRVVLAIFKTAMESNKNFSVIIPEGRPEGSGHTAAEKYAAEGIPTTVILDSAVAYYMETVDLVIVGAEGVVEEGGVVSKVGTYQMALVASSHQKPFYVAAESYKFARMFPLNQTDFPEHCNSIKSFKSCAENQDKVGPGVQVASPTCDYTPAKYITLLFTDLGVLTPSAVSDELIRLYQ